MKYYLANLQGIPIVNQSREMIGKLLDVVTVDINKPRPRVSGFVIKRGINKERVFIPAHDVHSISTAGIKLSTDIVDLTPFNRKPDEVLLMLDVYDKQIVDIDDRRLTRVNDLEIEDNQNLLHLTGVDISTAGLLTRLHLPNINNVIKHNIVDWEDVQFLGGTSPMKFKIQYQNLESLHPVDIARIIFEGPGYKQGSKVLSELKEPIVADIIEGLSPKLQKNLIESMKLEDVAQVVRHMSADKATDLLIALGYEYARKILPLLEKKQSTIIEQLLHYPESSTGAYMTTDYIAIPQGITLEHAFEKVRSNESLPDFLLYFYVLENEFSNKLVGVVSIYELFSKDLRTRVETAMIKNVIFAYPNDHIKDTLKKLYRYNISAIPVVTRNDKKLLGIVTFREAVTAYLPKRWKIRVRRVFNGS